MDIFYIDRRTKQKIKEIVTGEKLIKWNYESTLGRTLGELLGKRKFLSWYYGKLQDKPSSKNKIKKFAQTLGIDMKEAKRENYEQYDSFNDFFAREIKEEARPIVKEVVSLASPADGRVFAYENIDIDRVIQVKGFEYSLGELFGDSKLAYEYQGGVCYVIRLCPADYHRFHFCDFGTVGSTKKIKGNYYSVNPIALNKIPELYCRNKREVTLFESDNFGKIAYVEVGATAVGTIIQTFQEGNRVFKGEEKGYFKFGGSTVILFFQKGTVKVDNDILEHTEGGYETKVNMGEKIGTKMI